MSSLIVEVCKIDEINKHDNADKLELATVKGWQCIVPKDKFKVGDKIIYIPIDAMIPFKLSEKLGITKYLSNYERDKSGNITFSRIRTIKLRGMISQGLIIDLEDQKLQIGTNIKDKLGIKKYISLKNENHEKPLKNIFFRIFPYKWFRRSGWRLPEFSNFHRYTEIENIKNYQNILQEGEEVIVTEKLHGTNARYGKLPIIPSEFKFMDRMTMKIRKIGNKLTFGYINSDDIKLMVGSHNCNIKQLKSKREQILYKSMMIYWNIALKYELDKKLHENEIIYGEIYGTGIQKILEYDGTEEIKARFFDLGINKATGFKYLDWDDFVYICDDLELPIVPVLYRGPFNKEILKELTIGDSTLGDHIREGVVVKPTTERFNPKIGRVILKSINPEYLIFKGKKEDELAKLGKDPELDIFDH